MDNKDKKPAPVIDAITGASGKQEKFGDLSGPEILKAVSHKIQKGEVTGGTVAAGVSEVSAREEARLSGLNPEAASKGNADRAANNRREILKAVSSRLDNEPYHTDRSLIAAVKEEVRPKIKRNRKGDPYSDERLGEMIAEQVELEKKARRILAQLGREARR
jgi:hypothetical protein